MISPTSLRGTRRRWATGLAAVAALAALAMVTGFATGASAGDASVHLVQADARGVSFELTCGDGVPPPAGAGAAHDSTLGQRTVWIGVPEGASLAVSATVLTERRFAGPARGAATSPAAAAPLLARIALVTGLRAQRVAAIELRPVRLDAASGQWVVATRLAVRVDFVGAAPPPRTPAPEPAFEPVYRDVLLNYESARAFRRAPGGAEPGRAATARAFAGPAAGRAGAPLGFDVASTWTRVRVDRKGIQVITGADLAAAGVALAAIDPAALRVFTRPGLPLLDEGAACDTCGLAEVAIRVDDGGDGRFDADDRILFFGLGASGWRDEFTGVAGDAGEWLDHPYSPENVYWLTWDAHGLAAPARWSRRDVAPVRAGAWPAPSYRARLHLEEDHAFAREYQDGSRPWDPYVWAQMWSFQGNSPPLDLVAEAAGAVAERPVRLRARFWAPPGYTTPHQVAVTFDGTALPPLTWTYPAAKDLDTTGTWLVDGANHLRLTLLGNLSMPDNVDFLWWQLEFARRFEAVDDSLAFASADTTGPVAYAVAPFQDASPDSLTLLDVTDPLRPVELVGWTAADTTGGRAIHFDDEGAARSYFAACARRRAHPVLEPATVRDIRGGGADYLVLCADAFAPQAERLAAHRRSAAPPFAGALTAVVRMSDVLAWYSGGRMDPVAIRNFLSDAVRGRRWSPAPSYVCLLGDASYDFKGVLAGSDLALGQGQVPTFGHVTIGDTYASDDWLADLDPDPAQQPTAVGASDVILGRLPAANAAEADVLVDKVIAYDTAPELGPWRDRLLQVVDDIQQGNNPDPIGGGHIEQADSLERGYVPGWLGPAKVSLIEYPFTQGTEKGGARDAVKRNLDAGAVFWQFIGHGSATKLADESAFEIGDVAAMANGARQPFFLASGCTIGPFDTPGSNWLAEALVKRPTGGAIATLAGTVETYSYANYLFGRAVYSYLLPPPEAGGARTIGEATFDAKLLALAPYNDHRYNLLGDPGLRLATPRHDVRIRLFDDATGAALVDSLRCGVRVRLEADVFAGRDSLAALLGGFTGRADVRVTDAPALVQVPVRSSFTIADTISYLANPRTAYEAWYPVAHGHVTARFVVPARSSLGGHARASVYVEDGAADGSGALALTIVDGPAGAADTTDTVGPAIACRFAGGGTAVGPTEALAIALLDPSGIDALGGSLADAIRLAIDDGPPADLTSQFRYDAASYTRGSVAFALPGLPDGEHVIRVTAADALARGTSPHNRSSATFAFTVASVVDTAAVRSLALPNPFVGRTGTRLVFTGLAPGSAAEVDVFSVSGRLVRHLAGQSAAGHVEVDWDGRDADGRSARTGVYFYRAHVRPSAGGGAARRFDGRLVLLP